MFDDDDTFKDFNKRFKERWDENEKSFERAKHVHEVMGVVVPVLVGLGALVMLAVCCGICCRRRNRGRILAPPVVSSGTATYPQQQYTMGVATYPVHHVSTAAPYPTATHTVTPYPTATHPTVTPAPYPTVTPAPYPTASPAPYPTSTPYSAPSAPLVDAPPPSYDQVQNEMKSTPYNPNYPH